MNRKAISIITSVAMLCLGVLAVPQQSQAAPPTFTLTFHIVYTSADSDGLPETYEISTSGVPVNALKDIGPTVSVMNNPNSPIYERLRDILSDLIFGDTGETDIDILAAFISVTPER